MLDNIKLPMRHCPWQMHAFTVHTPRCSFKGFHYLCLNIESKELSIDGERYINVAFIVLAYYVVIPPVNTWKNIHS